MRFFDMPPTCRPLVWCGWSENLMPFSDTMLPQHNNVSLRPRPWEELNEQWWVTSFSVLIWPSVGLHWQCWLHGSVPLCQTLDHFLPWRLAILSILLCLSPSCGGSRKDHSRSLQQINIEKEQSLKSWINNTINQTSFCCLFSTLLFLKDILC